MQLSMNLGALSGTEKFAPIAHGDIIVTHKGARHVVMVADENNDGAVYCTVNLATGAECVVLAREVAYRSR